MLGFYAPLTAKVIRRLGLGLKSHPKDFNHQLNGDALHLPTRIQAGLLILSYKCVLVGLAFIGALHRKKIPLSFQLKDVDRLSNSVDANLNRTPLRRAIFSRFYWWFEKYDTWQYKELINDGHDLCI